MSAALVHFLDNSGVDKISADKSGDRSLSNHKTVHNLLQFEFIFTIYNVATLLFEHPIVIDISNGYRFVHKDEMLKSVNIIYRSQSFEKFYKQNCTWGPSQHYTLEQFGHVVLNVSLILNTSR